jgi:Protein of unknown function (DUF3240)
MIDAEQDRVAVTLNAAPALEERVVDWLLTHAAAGGFTSYAAHGHGVRHDALSVAEQVSGRQRRIEFRTEVAAAELEEFLRLLAARFAGTDLYYFVTPVLRSGHLEETPKRAGLA